MRTCVPAVALVLLVAGVHGAPRQDVTMRAYINVSSGCQAATVDFLNQLKTRYAPNMSLEMIDFGDGGRGMERWRQSGHKCMTIELNGTPLVKFPHAVKTRVVAFRMPAGFYWTHPDLEQAVQAGLRGELRPATEQELQSAGGARASVTTGAMSHGGKRYAAIKINGAVAMMLPPVGGTAAALKRAAVVAQSLRAWLAGAATPGQLTLQQTPGGWAVNAAGRKLITASAADAQAMGRSSRALAEDWLNGVRRAMVATP